LVKRAKRKGINISGLTENAIKRQLGESIDADDEELKCSKCGIHLPKATAERPDEGLIWLWPDEIWICSRCLNFEVRRIIVGVTG